MGRKIFVIQISWVFFNLTFVTVNLTSPVAKKKTSVFYIKTKGFGISDFCSDSNQRNLFFQQSEKSSFQYLFQ